MRTPSGSAVRPALFLCTLAPLSLSLAACGPQASEEAQPAAATVAMPTAAGPAGTGSHVVSATPEESGRYLVLVGGCNDCHTDGFMTDPAGIPESEWLKGSAVGFRGPWGTSYPRNLRLTAAKLTEDEWVARLRGAGLPPMPWYNVNHLAEADARAIHRYIRSLGEPGLPAPVALPPDVEPTTPWLDFVPHAPSGTVVAGGE